MNKIFVIPIFTSLVFITGCSIDSKINKIGSDHIISDTESLESATTTLINRYDEIPQKLWPESYKKLKPIQVKGFNRGIVIIKKQSERRESGVYIITESPEIEPESGSGEGYRKIDDRIYWVDIKIRLPVKLKPPVNTQ